MTKIALIGEFHDAEKKLLKETILIILKYLITILNNLKKELADCDGIGIRTAKLPKEVLTHLQILKLLQAWCWIRLC